jgi:hypothetical protein
VPRRGLSEIEPVQIGAWYGTCDVDGSGAGTSSGRPLRGTWHEADDYDPTGGVTKINAAGQARGIFYPPPKDGAGWKVTLEFSRFDPTTLPTLWEQFVGNEPANVTVTVSDGRVWTGKCRLDYREGNPISAPGDHPRYGDAGQNLKIRMIATEGEYGS